jgi:hypothetical protein
LKAVEIQTRVKKLIVPIVMGALCVSFTSPQPNVAVATMGTIPVERLTSPVSTADAMYDKMGLEYSGLSKAAFTNAYKGYEKLLQSGKLGKGNILTICDFSKSSAEKRLFIIDIATEELLVHTYVAHGKNSGGEFANSFSNRPESLQSSLGFFVTDQTYTGKHGLSLRLKGVDGRFNDKAYERTIVIHGAAYVNEERLRNGGYMGRSWGCPAVSQEESTQIINTIKNGSCFFIYYPSQDYLNGSKILNG